MTIGDIYEALKDGDTLSDAEIEFGIKKLESLVCETKNLGPRFHLFWKELYFDLDKLKSFRTARREAKDWHPKALNKI